LAERDVANVEVVGSLPVSRSMPNFLTMVCILIILFAKTFWEWLTGPFRGKK
jgi:hypothetical protein